MIFSFFPESQRNNWENSELQQQRFSFMLQSDGSLNITGLIFYIMYITYDHLAYNGKGQQFYYTHWHFNIPIQKPIAKFFIVWTDMLVPRLSDSNPYSDVELRPWTFQWDLTLYLLIWTVSHINRSLHHWAGNQGLSQYSHSHVSGTMFMCIYVCHRTAWINSFTRAPGWISPLKVPPIIIQGLVGIAKPNNMNKQV